MSGNGPQTEIYKFGAECRSKVVGLHVDSRKDTISTGILPAASFEFSLRKPVDFTGPNCFHFETLQIFHCRGFTWHMFSQGAQSNLQLPAGYFGCSVSKLCRSIVGTPPNVDWNAVWNKVLHLRNERVKNFIANAHANS